MTREGKMEGVNCKTPRCRYKDPPVSMWQKRHSNNNEEGEEICKGEAVKGNKHPGNFREGGKNHHIGTYC